MVFSEKELIEACQKGDMQNFSYFYEKYVDNVYKFIYLKTFDKELSEDITSEVFIKAISKLHTYNIRQDATFKSWILKIAYNSIIDYYRTRKQEPSLEDVAERGYLVDMAEHIDKKEKSKKVLAFLDTLGEREKKIVVMRFWDELSFKEIADITGESEDNCKKIVYRSIKKMDVSTLILLIIITTIL